MSSRFFLNFEVGPVMTLAKKWRCEGVGGNGVGMLHSKFWNSRSKCCETNHVTSFHFILSQMWCFIEANHYLSSIQLSWSAESELPLRHAFHYLERSETIYLLVVFGKNLNQAFLKSLCLQKVSTWTCQVQVESVRLNVRTDRLGPGQSELIRSRKFERFVERSKVKRPCWIWIVSPSSARSDMI